MTVPAAGARWRQLLAAAGEAVVSTTALAALGLLRLVDVTLDVRVYGHEHLALARRRGRRVLFVVWHGKGLIPILFFQGWPLVIYTSHPRAPAYGRLARAARRFTLAALRQAGYRVVDAAQFASESRGVIRFLQMLEETAGGIIAADGPAGPSFRAKPGAAFVAKRAGVALVPVGAALLRGLALDSWDRFELPVPFSTAVLAIGEMLTVPDDADDRALAALSRRLEAALNDLTARAEIEAFAIAPARTPA